MPGSPFFSVWQATKLDGGLGTRLAVWQVTKLDGGLGIRLAVWQATRLDGGLGTRLAPQQHHCRVLSFHEPHSNRIDSR